MHISDDIRYIGVDDHEVDLFEGMYDVPNGMAYNSYVILDEKVAVMDAVDARFAEQWLEKLQQALAGRRPDYLVIHHMEPDHSGSLLGFIQRYPEAKLVATERSWFMLKNYLGFEQPERCLSAKEGESLCLGRHELQFFHAPMVHWPEVMVSYDRGGKVLFSADAFGKFGALDVQEDWACEARRYYFGIVGKYGLPVQNLLKKLGGLDIQLICPLHGPVLKEDLGYYLDLYNTWSSYGVESEGIVIAYTSVYGHTKAAVELLAKGLEDKGIKVAVNDLARCDMAEAVEDAFRYGTLVLATTTYNGDAFPFMREFIHHLTERGYRKRSVAMIENGSWAPMAAKVMKNMLAGCKELRYIEPVVTILSALNEGSRAQLDELTEALLKTQDI